MGSGFFLNCVADKPIPRLRFLKLRYSAVPEGRQKIAGGVSPRKERQICCRSPVGATESSAAVSVAPTGLRVSFPAPIPGAYAPGYPLSPLARLNSATSKRASEGHQR